MIMNVQYLHLWPSSGKVLAFLEIRAEFVMVGRLGLDGISVSKAIFMPGIPRWWRGPTGRSCHGYLDVHIASVRYMWDLADTFQGCQ